jgi:uncharacterized protein YqeY
MCNSKLNEKPCIYSRLNKRLREAMLARDREMSTMIRAIKAKVEEYEVAHKMARNEMPNDRVMVTVIQAHKKSLEKGILQLKKGGEKSNDLVEEYTKEINLCDGYLPSVEDQKKEIVRIVDNAVSELNATSLKQMGRVIGHIMKNNIGLDGKLVKEAVLEKLKE